MISKIKRITKQILYKIYTFLKLLVSDNDTVSHKRVISLLSFIILICITGLYIYIPSLYNQIIYLTFASLSFGESLLTKMPFKK